MEFAQRGEQRPDERKQLIGRYASAALVRKLLQRRALHVLHNEIGGVVLFEKVTRSNHDGELLQLRKPPCLFKKAFSATLEVFFRCTRIACHLI